MFRINRNPATIAGISHDINRDKTRAQLADQSANRADLYDKLCQIQDDNSLMVCSPDTDSDIIYDKDQFKYSAGGAFIGMTPEDVVRVLSQSNCFETSVFTVKPITDRSLLITCRMTRDSVKAFFDQYRTWGTVYLKNPDAQVCILNGFEHSDLVIDVHFHEMSTHKTMMNISVDDLCDELGL